MSRHAWITPDDAPGAAECRPVFVPSGRAFEAAFRGAFLLLCDPVNWEAHGAQTPEDIAAAFEAAFFQTVDNWEGMCRVHHVGEIFLFGAYPPPDGAVICDGSIILITTYPALYEVIGTTFGGDGVTTFALPDLRGRVPLGVGEDQVYFNLYSLGDSGGDAKHTLTGAEMPQHHHTVSRRSTAGGANARLEWTTAANAVAVENTSDVGSNQPHNNMQAYLALWFLIQAE